MVLDTPISIDSRGGKCSLFDVLSRIEGDAPVELLHLEPHQRAPMATALAVIMAALKRYPENPPSNALGWHVAWDRQIGPAALRLVAPEGEAAFFQPPFDGGKNRSSMILSDIDLTFTKAAHAAKPIPDGDAEEAVLPLQAGRACR